MKNPDFNETNENPIPLLSYGRTGVSEYINPNLLAYNALLHSDPVDFIYID